MSAKWVTTPALVADQREEYPNEGAGALLMTAPISKMVGGKTYKTRVEGGSWDDDDDYSVSRLESRMRRGEPLPPVLVYLRGGKYIVRDGHHRLTAARNTKLKEVPVLVVQERESLGWLTGRGGR